jgi:hypothetical protein
MTHRVGAVVSAFTVRRIVAALRSGATIRHRIGVIDDLLVFRRHDVS